MTRTNLALAPDQPLQLDANLLERLIRVMESLNPDVGLRTYSPKEAAAFLGKTENWVTEQIQLGTIPFTRIGKTPRLTAEHIKWVQANGEVLPHRYSPRPLAA
ncbi:helix-turn-helix domain-containing protein [Streptomyces filamentosus]|uniref:helix-turn-helix domain-containing protein n=1 Tax=Streptomyces filamentosus TaxID=67294 RepID=UPI00123ADB39|nr:helix-turn-helix domain-containing protein [Streptomyces filamentosus]KAA6216453.1 DNA-binding protein [Streptomyces filamentosus]